MLLILPTAEEFSILVKSVWIKSLKKKQFSFENEIIWNICQMFEKNGKSADRN